MSNGTINSPDELLDLVDENDRVIGTALKSEAHHNTKLIHREVAMLVYDGQNQLLLQQRSFAKKVHPGQWCETCAGHIGSGESTESAAHRELQEELGFDTKLTFIGKYRVNDTYETHFSYWYLGLYQGQSVHTQPEEVQEARFFTKQEYEKLKNSGTPVGQWGDIMITKFWAGEFDQYKR